MEHCRGMVPGTLGTLGTEFEESVYDLRKRFVEVSNLYDGFGIKKPDNPKMRGVHEAIQKGLATCFECKIIQWVSQGGDPIETKERVAEHRPFFGAEAENLISPAVKSIMKTIEEERQVT